MAIPRPDVTDHLVAQIDGEFSDVQKRRIAESIQSGSGLAAAAHANPMVFADEFIREMQDGVVENFEMNNGPYSGWIKSGGAAYVISIYDESLGEPGEVGYRPEKFPEFSAAEQAYIVRKLDDWLQRKQAEVEANRED
jgi:hypothetical protein